MAEENANLYQLKNAEQKIVEIELAQQYAKDVVVAIGGLAVDADKIDAVYDALDVIEVVADATIMGGEYVVAGLPALGNEGDLAVNVLDGNIYEWQTDTWVLVAISGSGISIEVDANGRMEIAGNLNTLDDLTFATEAKQDIIDANVDIMVAGIITGTCSGTPTSTASNTDLSGYPADQVIGRTLTFLTGDSEGAQTELTDFVVTDGVITYTAINGTVPVSGDTFKIT